MERKFFSRLMKAIGLIAVLAVGFLQLPVCAAQVEMATQVELEDGAYTIDVTMEGGSGKSTVVSPAILIVMDGRAYARIEWSSSNYDYMKVGDKKFLPVNTEGNSTFEIPITVFDEPMPVIGDTTAMSTPHEVEYKLIFAADSIAAKGQPPQTVQKVLCIGIIVVALGAVAFFVRRKRRHI